jgi:5-methylcytosine-specific restriction endonuclease McrA
MKRDRSLCIYCGAAEDLTVDHVPPKNLFPKPRPSDLITVPACRTCNKSYERDDDYFRLAMTVLGEANPVAGQLWREKGVSRLLTKSIG